VIPNITRGGNTLGVLRYLLGKGRREEHQDPHLVAGSPEASLRAGGRLLELRDAGVLARFLDEPREVFGTAVQIAERDQNGRVVGSRQAHVWHCSLSLEAVAQRSGRSPSGGRARASLLSSWAVRPG
jgi:hypothetical protein